MGLGYWLTCHLFRKVLVFPNTGTKIGWMLKSKTLRENSQDTAIPSDKALYSAGYSSNYSLLSETRLHFFQNKQGFYRK